MKLSIVIVNYKTADLTKKLLASIFDGQSGFYNQESEVVVVDNDSSDGCGRMVKKDFPQVEFIQTGKNLGFSGGYNLGIKKSRGEYVLILNSDIEVKPGMLQRMVQKANKYQGEAVLGGRLYFPDGTIQDSCFFLPTIQGAIKEYFLGQKGAYFMFTPPGIEDTRVECTVAACWLIPRKVLNRVGLLDEGTFLYFEDIDYARRMKRLGIPMYYCPDCEYIHHHGAASKKIGVSKSQDYLIKASKHYHGLLTYWGLTIVLWLGQKWGKTNTPKSRWKVEN